MKTDRFEIKLDNCTVIATNDEPAQFPKPHTFPTWEEFEDWYHDEAYVLSDRDIYNFFRDRIQPLEIGREYDVSDDKESWVRTPFRGYAGLGASSWKHIRPIQDPKQELINRLKAVDDPTGAVADAIKALEGKK